MCVQGDMTMALDVALRHFQCFWPWAAEFGLIDAIMSIFMPEEKAANGPGPPQLQPWMYVNVVVEHAQALVPLTGDLLDVDAALKTCKPDSTLANLVSRITRNSGGIARISKQVMERPRMFQLMSQVTPPPHTTQILVRSRQLSGPSCGHGVHVDQRRGACRRC